MKTIICGILIYFAVLSEQSLAQKGSPALSDTSGNVLEFENSEEETLSDNDESPLTNYLEELANNPVNINLAEITDFLRVPYLTISDASAIIRYRKENGYLRPVDLKNVPGIELMNIQRAIPYLTEGAVKPPSTIDKFNISWSDVSLNYRTRIVQDMQVRKGFRDGSFQGSSPKIYNKFNLQLLHNYSLGCVIEKDAGEPLLYDYFSAYLYLRELGIIDKLIVGDYDLEFFQGLALGNSYNFGKGAEINYLNVGEKNARPHSSAEENRFFRGGAISLIISKIRLTLFYSKKSFDAVEDFTTQEITSLVVDGFHRTKTERMKSNKTEEEFIGGRLDFRLKEKLSIGLLFSSSAFTLPFKSDFPYGKNGSRFNYFSGGYNYPFLKFMLQGEVCSDRNGTISTINSLFYEINRQLHIILSYRNFPEKFISLHGNGFGDVSNEKGIFGGVKINTGFGTISSYYDIFHIPGPSYFNPEASSGREFYINYLLKADRISLDTKYKHKEKEKYSSYWGKSRIEKVHRLKLEFEYCVNKNLSVKGKSNYSNYNWESDNNEIGYSYSIGLKLNTNFKLHLDLNFIIFNTDSYNSSIYEYENELKGLSGMNSLFGSGSRWFFVLQYLPVKSIGFSLKYSETRKSGVKSIYSGENEISGNLDNKIKAQLDFSF